VDVATSSRPTASDPGSVGGVHPIERLRYVARATGAPADSVLREAASSLAGFAEDPVSLVTACRRLVDRHPANGPIWWLAASVLTAVDPVEAAWACVDRFDADRSLREVAEALPEEARVCVVGWPPRLVEAFGRRGDLEVRVVDVEGDGPGFVRVLEDAAVPAVDIDITGLGGAAATADVVVLDASAIGPEVALVPAGSWPLAAIARSASVPVWLVGGVGRRVSAGTWPALFGRLVGGATAPWDGGLDRLPVDLVDRTFGPDDDRVDAPELWR
jgi:hypothetical protein